MWEEVFTTYCSTDKDEVSKICFVICFFYFLVIYTAVCEIILSCACVWTWWQRAGDQRDTAWRRGGALVFAHELKWVASIVSQPSEQLWGADPRSQPSIRSPAAKSGWYLEDADGLSAPLVSAVKSICVTVIELCLPFMERCYFSLFQITALHQPLFFSVDQVSPSFSSDVNEPDAVSLF